MPLFDATADFGRLPSLNFVSERRSTAPIAPVVGQRYFDTALGQEGYYTGAAWAYLGGPSVRRGTAITNTAVASIDLAVPPGVSRITLMTAGFSIAENSQIQMGSGGGVVQSTGYSSRGSWVGTWYGWGNTQSSGFPAISAGIPPLLSVSTFFRITGNTWVMSASSTTWDTHLMFAMGVVTLSGELDIIRLIPPSGSFAAGGTVNIFVE